MSVFIDTNIFAAAKLKNDVDHEHGKALLEEALLGKYGPVLTSDYIFDEIITLLNIRSKNHQLVFEFGNSILTSGSIDIIKINDEIFEAAWDKFGRFKDKLLSFTDCTTLAIMEKLKIEKIMSFDRHFDGIRPEIVRIF
jgi:predicted nucleic acid-binding protein